MKKWWYLIFFFILVPIVNAQYYYSLEYELTNLLSLFVGGGSPSEIFTKFLIFIVLFAVLFNKVSIKFFGENNKSIAAIVALIVAILGMRFMPLPILEFLLVNFGVFTVFALLLGIWWLTYWFKSKVARHIIFTILCIITIYVVSALSEIEPFRSILETELWGYELKGIILFALVASALISLFTMGRSRGERLEEEHTKTETEKWKEERKFLKEQRKNLKSSKREKELEEALEREREKANLLKEGKKEESAEKIRSNFSLLRRIGIRNLENKLTSLRDELGKGRGAAASLHKESTKAGWTKTKEGKEFYKAWYRQYSRNINIEKEIKEVENRIKHLRSKL